MTIMETELDFLSFEMACSVNLWVYFQVDISSKANISVSTGLIFATKNETFQYDILICDRTWPQK